MEKTFMLIWLVMLATKLEAFFTTLPTTRHVWVGQTATFECATNISGYTLSLIIPAGIEHKSLSADLQGGGTLATVTFTVTSSNNGSSVRCLADNGFDTQFTAPVYAYAIAMSVTNLRLKVVIEPRNCLQNITWSPPYLLPGLTVSYNISISSITDDVITTTDTSYSYVPTLYGSHDLTTVTVTPFDGPITGESATVYTSSIIPEIKKDAHDIKGSSDRNLIRRNNTMHNSMLNSSESDWTYFINIPDLCVCPLVSSSVIIMFDPVNSTDNTTHHSNITVQQYQKGDNVAIEPTVRLPDKRNFTAYMSVKYDKADEIVTESFEISTYDLQIVTPFDISSKRICLNYTRVIGSLTDEVFTLLQCDRSNTTKSYHFSEGQFGTECYDNIDENTYVLSSYDEKEDIKLHNPAVVIDHVIEIPGPSVSDSIPTVIPSSSVVPTAAITLATDMVQQSTYIVDMEPSMISTTKRDMHAYMYIIIGAVTMILIVMITTVLSIVLMICFRRKQTKIYIEEKEKEAATQL